MSCRAHHTRSEPWSNILSPTNVPGDDGGNPPLWTVTEILPTPDQLVFGLRQQEEVTYQMCVKTQNGKAMA